MVTSIVSTKRSLFFGVIVIAAVTSSLFFFAKVEARTNNAHRVLSITATVAASESQSCITRNIIMDLLKKLTLPLQWF